jgi:hypothetical protein
MRALILTTILLATTASSQAAVRTPEMNACNDRNALDNVAIDARATVIQYYYRGYVQNLPDKEKQACFEGHVLMDDHFAVINKALMLMGKGLHADRRSGPARRAGCLPLTSDRAPAQVSH